MFLSPFSANAFMYCTKKSPLVGKIILNLAFSSEILIETQNCQVFHVPCNTQHALFEIFLNI